ncbi:MAG: hypothetical protein ACREMJ_08810 [Gemmatimonadales bacterium]
MAVAVPRSRFGSLLLAAAVATGACHDATTPPVTSPFRPQASTLADVAQDPTPDQKAVARVVPGFGGYFLAGGAPTVYLTDPAQRPAAEQALGAFLSTRGFTSADLVVRQARYDYLELDAWHEAAWPAALSVSGAVLSDLDEGHNRLRFGGVDGSAVAAMAAAVAGAGVPSDAYVVQQVAAVELRNTLQDRVRPVPGGYQINFFATPSAVTLLCTLGFNAIPEGPPFAPNASFVTNSHCSNTEGDGAANPTNYYQPLRGGVTFIEENFIGTEADDPAMTVSADCPLALPCRWSDASRAEYAEGVPFELGRIARPAAFDPVQGTLDVDPKRPTFEIVDEQPFAVLGETANKVGRTTGWTGGEITATCVNVIAIGGVFVRRCQAFVAAGSAGGDSGSPVFGSTNRRGNAGSGKVILFGILWGGSVEGDPEFVYSPTFNIERELGLLTTH